MTLILSALVVLAAGTGFLVYRHASAHSVSRASAWGLVAFLTAGLGAVPYVMMGRHHSPPKVVSMRERLPNAGRRPAQVSPQSSPLRMERQAPAAPPSVPLPADPWGLEADRSVAPLMTRPERREEQPRARPDESDSGRIAQPRS